MAMRKPVIACDSGGVPEIITHGKDGWLVEPRSAEAVAAAIDTLLGSPERRRQMGERARETVRARFSPRQQCVRAALLYAGLTRRKSPCLGAWMYVGIVFVTAEVYLCSNPINNPSLAVRLKP
jgi:hypothetical protein